jgi:hypothetical protein
MVMDTLLSNVARILEVDPTCRSFWPLSLFTHNGGRKELKSVDGTMRRAFLRLLSIPMHPLPRPQFLHAAVILLGTHYCY